MPLSAINPDNYQQQLEEKKQRISKQFAAHYPQEISVFESPSLHYRMRSEFRVWHNGDESFYAMFKPEAPKTLVQVDQFPAASEAINTLMPQLMAVIKEQAILRIRLFQCEFLSTLSGEMLVTLIYHKALDEEWQAAAKQLQTQFNIQIIGRSRKQKVVLNTDYVTECLNVDNKPFYFQQVEGSFTQPNAKINEKMLSWALEKSKDSQGDLIELYCGNGNFTLVLAQNFKRVLATEISKTSVRSAQHNIALNQSDNVTIVRMSSEEFSSALLGEKSFNRLAGIDLSSYHFSTVLVDPPRAGLDEQTIELIRRFETIIYISCNPDTLENNLNALSNSHSVADFAIFDQFPYTHHIESGVKLIKKPNQP